MKKLNPITAGKNLIRGVKTGDWKAIASGGILGGGASGQGAAQARAGIAGAGAAGAGAPVYPGSTKNTAQYPGARTKVEGGYSVTGATKSGKKYTSTHDRDSRGRRRETHTIAGGGTYVKNRRTRGYSLRLR